MKICADEHVSTEIVRAVRDMALGSGFELTSVRELGEDGQADVHWITRFANNGGGAILSADTDFFKRPHQVMAVQKTGLKVIHLPARWANSRCELQAAHILLWWRRIEATLVAMQQRECYRPPWNIAEDGALQKIAIDFHDAERKLKREEVRATKSQGNNDNAKEDGKKERP